MRISVVIPTFCRPDLLLEALQSVAHQSYSNWEIIVVDDGSTPPVSAAAIRRIVGDRFQLMRHATPQGTAVSKNLGVSAATGGLITLLDDDDALKPAAFEAAVDAFVTYPSLDCLFVNIEPFGIYAKEATKNQGAALATVISKALAYGRDGVTFFGSALFSVLLQTTPIAMQRPVARAEVFRRVGGFSPGIMCPEPVWSARMALLGRTALLTTPLYRWRVDGQNHASRPTMRTNARQSIIRDRVNLLREINDGALGSHRDARLVRKSIAHLMLDQSADLLIEGQRARATKSLLRSLRYELNLRSMKTAARLVLPAPVRA